MRETQADSATLRGLQPVLKTALDAVIVLGGEGIILAWNQVAYETFGWTASEAVGHPLVDLIVPQQHRAAHCAGLARYQETGEARVLNRRIEITALRKNGAEIPVELSITASSGASGEVFIGYLRDISERHHAERALRESESYVRLLLDSTAEGFYAVNKDGTTTLCNQSFLQMMGFAKEADAVGHKLHDLIHHSHPDGSHYPNTECPIYQCAQTGSPAHILNELFFRLDGSAMPVEYWVHPIRRDGALEGAICTFLDVTDRMAAETALLELNQTLERRVEERTRERDRAWKNSRDLQVVVDGRGLFLAANEAWKSILGWEPEEVVGRRDLDFVHPDDQAKSENARDIALRTELPVYENRCRHKDGSYRWISWVAAPQDNLIYASGRHITAEKEAKLALEAAEEQLRQAQKMEAVGHLTGGIAHDFNNLLTVVTGNADMARRAIEAGETAKAQRSVANALKGAERAAELTQRLLAFSRRQPLSPKPTNVARLISGMSDMLARTLGETIQIETVFGAGLWQVDVDAHQLESAILNLAVNARDAMVGDGKLTIEASNARIGSTYASAKPEIAAGQYVVICVTDTGVGMPPETVGRAFDPFFTTKQVGQGTGLGLSQVYGFVKQSGGHVKIYSEVDHGSSIKLYLPRIAGTAQEEISEPGEPAEASGQRETILVVEDDDEVRIFTVEALRELGYRVLEAHDGPSAMRLLQRQQDPVDLLFTDVVMPEMSGRDLADQARTHQPGLKVLFTTGYARNAILHGGRLEPGVEVLPKPFAFDALAAKVRFVLDAAHIGRVLIIASEEGHRRKICHQVAPLGFSVELCSTIREALGKLRTIAGKFDAILVECTSSAGRKFIPEVRAIRQDLPILFMASGDSLDLSEVAKSDVCTGMIKLPFGPAELRPKLEKLMVRCAKA